MLARMTGDGRIEIAPLAFMRGRTFRNAAVILDEAQNATAAQMLMFLTRIGKRCRMIVTGDASQSDIDQRSVGGMADAAARHAGVEGVAIVELARSDIVRHPLVERIVEAYGRPQTPAQRV
jgi:phosphate starvation-inducible PhoH-like protein